MKSLAHRFLLLSLLSLPVIATAQDATRPLNSIPQTTAQAQQPPAEKILARAVEALGGENYTRVKTIAARGFFTRFKEGLQLPPQQFLDYVVLPDRERTEFKSAEGRIVQVNTGTTGWIFDGVTKAIKDQTPAQIADFRGFLRTSVDQFLRGLWRAEKAEIAYAGRRPAGLGKRNETVRVTYPDGFTVEFEFGAQDGLPAKASYKHTGEDGAEISEEDRFGQYVNLAGINTPLVIDHYINGKQASRVNYDTVEYNRPLPEALFARPATAKDVK